MRSTPSRPDRLFLAAAALSAAGLAGCTADPRDDSAWLAANREKWEKNRPAQYAYTLEHSCFCPHEFRGPFLVTAMADSVVSALRIGWPPPGGPPETTRVEGDLQGLSIAQAFAGAETLLAEDNEVEKTAFDPVYGFPATVSVDNPRREDDFMIIEISEFRRLDGE